MKHKNIYIYLWEFYTYFVHNYYTGIHVGLQSLMQQWLCVKGKEDHTEEVYLLLFILIPKQKRNGVGHIKPTSL